MLITASVQDMYRTQDRMICDTEFFHLPVGHRRVCQKKPKLSAASWPRPVGVHKRTEGGKKLMVSKRWGEILTSLSP